MGRELKRVSLDFDWSLNKVWMGYQNPYESQNCKVCDGSGYNATTKEISDNFYARNEHRWCDKITQDEVDTLIEEGRLWVFWRKAVPGGWEDIIPRPVVTASQVNAWEKGPGVGHDAINRGILIKARATRLGVYGLCPTCGGEGETYYTEAIKKAHEEWREFEPPPGEGYQLWETTTEGSPISPVFETLLELCKWCEGNATVFGDQRTTREGWFQMLSDNFVAFHEGNAVFI
jgi:hypothetical protein